MEILELVFVRFQFLFVFKIFVILREKLYETFGRLISHEKL